MAQWSPEESPTRYMLPDNKDNWDSEDHLGQMIGTTKKRKKKTKDKKAKKPKPDTPVEFDPEAFIETLSKQEEPPYKNPSPPPATPIPYNCPMHPGEPLERWETETQWGHWEYYRCPVPGCFVCCGAQDISSYMDSVQSQLNFFYRQVPPEKMKCFCIYPPIMSISHSEKNPGRLFFKCRKRQCEFFQWVDEHPQGKNRAWLMADKFTTLFNGQIVKRKREDILYETPLQRGVRHIVNQNMGPFEGNWDPQVTPKERLYLEKRGMVNQSDIKDMVRDEVEWHMYK